MRPRLTSTTEYRVTEEGIRQDTWPPEHSTTRIKALLETVEEFQELRKGDIFSFDGKTYATALGRPRVAKVGTVTKWIVGTQSNGMIVAPERTPVRVIRRRGE